MSLSIKQHKHDARLLYFRPDVIFQELVSKS